MWLSSWWGTIAFGENCTTWKAMIRAMIMHHRFNMVNASNGSQTICRADETVSPSKESDLVCSFLVDYISSELPTFLQNVRIFLDSAPYLRSGFGAWWVAEMLCRGKLKWLKLSFMVPGRTKIAPDVRFANIAHRFQESDAFAAE